MMAVGDSLSHACSGVNSNLHGTFQIREQKRNQIKNNCYFTTKITYYTVQQI